MDYIAFINVGIIGNILGLYRDNGKEMDTINLIPII